MAGTGIKQYWVKKKKKKMKTFTNTDFLYQS